MFSPIQSYSIIGLLILLGLSISLVTTLNAQTAPRLFDRLDKNNDGYLTRDELINPDTFDGIDKNKDSKITRLEALRYIRQSARNRRALTAPDPMAPKPYTLTKDIPYLNANTADKKLNALDIYSPNKKGTYPVIVMIHGGGWRNGDKSNPGIATGKPEFFTQQGYVYVAINYRLSPAVKHPTHVNDVAAALSWIYDNISKYQGNPDNIAIMGHSAGAHLAALVSTDDRPLAQYNKKRDIIKAAILLDGAGYDIPRYMNELTTMPALTEIYNNAFTDDPKAQADASPITHIKQDTSYPPTLTFYTPARKDSKIINESYVQKLNSVNTPAQTLPAKDKTHMTVNRDIGLPNDPVTKDITTFLDTHIKTTPKTQTKNSPKKDIFYAPNSYNRFTMKDLTPQEKHIIIDKGTEAPFTGKFNDFYEKGIYTCRQCGNALYLSDSKFKSHCGWPSFDSAIPDAVAQKPDADGRRTEILCARCDGHLGHVFTGEKYTPKDTRHCVNSVSMDFVPGDKTETAIFASGCFWGVQYHIQRVKGVYFTLVGYTGGHVENPTYKQVCTSTTGHAEAVLVTFDPSTVSYEELTKIYFETHDPTQANGQGPDIGPQYRSEIFYTNDAQKETVQKLIDILKDKGYNVVTQLSPAKPFFPAEDYHQNYYNHKGSTPYCHAYQKKFD